jgi:thiamine biosynthesis lipoprotein ApbE
LKRRWTVGGEWRHHLIDPGTGRPSDTDLDLAAVVAREAWIAEAPAKAVLLPGSERAFQLLGHGRRRPRRDRWPVLGSDGLTTYLCPHP